MLVSRQDINWDPIGYMDLKISASLRQIGRMTERKVHLHTQQLIMHITALLT